MPNTASVCVAVAAGRVACRWRSAFGVKDSTPAERTPPPTSREGVLRHLEHRSSKSCGWPPGLTGTHRLISSGMCARCAAACRARTNLVPMEQRQFPSTDGAGSGRTPHRCARRINNIEDHLPLGGVPSGSGALRRVRAAALALDASGSRVIHASRRMFSDFARAPPPDRRRRSTAAGAAR
jgi:hypothetical protein